jgi:hypothetical protein
MKKLTDKIRETIVSAIAAGNTFNQAAAKAGVHRATLYSWLERGAKEPEGQHGALWLAVQRARLAYHDKLHGIVVEAAEDRDAGRDWKAAAFLLERRFRNIYANVPEAQDDEVPQPRDEEMDLERAKEIARRGLEKAGVR